jgi:hypothetical protein
MNTLMEWIWGMVLFLSFLGLLISLSNEDILSIKITLLIIFVGIPTLIGLRDNKE